MSTTPASATDPAAPPVARKEPHLETVHGITREDDYYWLRNKDAADVVGYLHAENVYADAFMKPTETLQGTLYQEMVSRIKETDLSVPVKRGEWLYYSRTEKGQQYPIYCRKKGEAGAEAVLLDLNEIGKTEKFVGLGDFALSDDQTTLAYSLDTTGFRQYSLRFKDLASGTVSAEIIPRVTSVAFAKDGKTVFYAEEHPQTKRSYAIHRHTIGQDAAKDTLVYEDKDEMFDVGVGRSRSKEYLFIQSESKTTAEVRYLNAGHPTDDFKVFAPREHDHKYFVDHGGDLFYIRTNSGGRNYRLCTVKTAHPERAAWKEILPHRNDVMLEDIEVFRDFYVVTEREDATPELRITDIASGKSHRVALPETIRTIGGEPNPEFNQPAFRFSYQSPVTPKSVYAYTPHGSKLDLLKRTEVLGGYDPSHYKVQRVRATAADGTKIPIALLSGANATPDGTHPMLLISYGSYGIPYPNVFNANVLSLVDRGMTVAVAHIRGGGELGKRWHDEGRMMQKMNTFTDFIASAEELVKSGWAKKDALAIEGGSAGGLLMGAVANLRPDLFTVVVAHVPFVDVINTMMDETLPLTVGEFEEWGNPKVKEQYDYMMTYSPYDNVAARPYPTMLVKTSYNDSQVMYWEPAKWVAKLRATKTDHHPLVFKINMEPAGHGGQSGRYNQLREIAFDYSFLLTQLGVVRLEMRRRALVFAVLGVMTLVAAASCKKAPTARDRAIASAMEASTTAPPPRPATPKDPYEDATTAPGSDAEAARGTMSHPGYDEMLIEARPAIDARFPGIPPSSLSLQIAGLSSGQRAVLMTAPQPGPRPLLFLLDEQRKILWSKERPTGGLNAAVEHLALTTGEHGDVLLTFCDPSSSSVAARKWDHEGGLIIDFRLLELESCAPLSALLWPNHGWLVVTGAGVGSRAQLLTLDGKMPWGRDGRILRDAGDVASAKSIALDGDDTFVVLGVSRSEAGHGLSRVAMRYDEHGNPTWKTPVTVSEIPNDAEANRRPRLDQEREGIVKTVLARTVAGGRVIDEELAITSDGRVLLP